MADLNSIVDSLSSLTIMEAAELATLLEAADLLPPANIAAEFETQVLAAGTNVSRAVQPHGRIGVLFIPDLKGWQMPPSGDGDLLAGPELEAMGRRIPAPYS